MLIHCTLKLSRKLPAVAAEPLPVDSRLGSWTANLVVIDRRQCVLACHDQTRFPLFLPGLRKEQFQQLGPLLQRLFIDCLRTAGFPDSQIARARLALGAAHFDRKTDRSVLATLNQFGQGTTARVYHRLPNVLLVDPVAESLALADTPITVHGKWVDWPLKGMQKLLADLQAD